MHITIAGRDAYAYTGSRRFEVTPGDWIITDVEGKHPVRPGTFAVVYERA